MKLKSIRSVVLAAMAAVGLSGAAFAAGADGEAKIGDVTYPKLSEALAAVGPNDTVVLQKSCELTAPFTNVSANVTLDLAQGTITYAGSGFAFLTKGAGSKLTIKNGTFDGTGEKSCFFRCEADSDFELNGVTADQASSDEAIVRYSSGHAGLIANCTIGGGYTRSSNAVKLGGDRDHMADENFVTIVDSKIVVPGTVEPKKNWNWNDYYGSAALMFSAVGVVIRGEGTEVRGPVHAIYASTLGGKLQIEGGKYSADADFFATLAFDHPSWPKEKGGWMTQDVTITGGEFTGRVFTYDTTSVNISGGEFKSFQGWNGYNYDGSKTKLSITGGTFDSDPNLFATVDVGSDTGPKSLNPTPSGVKPFVATATNKVGVKGDDGLWTIVDAAQVSAVAGANSKLSMLEVDGEAIYDTENPVVGTIYPYSESGMVVEGFEPVKMKVAYDTVMTATYVANDGYHFGEWMGDESETMRTKTGMACEDVLNLDGDAAVLPPSADDVTWIGEEGAQWGVAANWQENLVPSTTATVHFTANAVVDLNQDATINNIDMTGGSELTFMTAGDTKRTLTVDGQRYDTYYFCGYGTLSFVGANVAAAISTTCTKGISAHGTYRAAGGATVTMAGVNPSDNTMAFVAEGDDSAIELTAFKAAEADADVTFAARDGGEVMLMGGANLAYGTVRIAATNSFVFSALAIAGAKPEITVDGGTFQVAGVTSHAAGGSIALVNGGELCLNGNLVIGNQNALTLTSDGTGAIAVDNNSESATITLGAKATVNLTVRPDITTNALFQTRGGQIAVNAGTTFNVNTTAFDNLAGDSWEVLLADQGSRTTWTNFETPVLKASGNYDLSIKKDGAKAYLVIARPQPPVTYDWIRSNGKGYIETGWKLGFDATYTLNGQFAEAPTTEQCIFSTAGNEDATKKLFMTFWPISGSEYAQASFYYTPDQVFVEYKSFDAVKFTQGASFDVRVAGNVATVNGKPLTAETSAEVLADATDGNLCFFQDVGNSERNGDYKLYGMKVYDAAGSKLVCEFIPAKQGDSVGLIERQYGDDGVTVAQEFFRTPSAAGFEVGNDEPAGPTVNGNATITGGEGAWTVTPNGEKAITVSGLNAGDKVTVPVDSVESVAGVPPEDLILTVNGVEVDNQYFVGLLDGGTAFITELGEKAAPVIGEEGVEAPFVVADDAVSVTIKPIDGLYYQLLRGTELTDIAEIVDEKTLGGVYLTLTLTDGAKPAAGAFYKVGVTKTQQKSDE